MRDLCVRTFLFRYKTILFKKEKKKVVHQHQRAEMTRVSSPVRSFESFSAEESEKKFSGILFADLNENFCCPFDSVCYLDSFKMTGCLGFFGSLQENYLNV